MSTAIGVGKEILSNCSKCKLILAHIIVSMKSLTAPDKVMCKTCKSTQSFKDPSAKKKKTSVARVIKTARSAGRKSTETVGEMWTKALNKATQEFKDYTIRGSFQMGDIINHPTFGQGIVEKLIDDNKIEVLFQDDFRTLMHKK